MGAINKLLSIGEKSRIRGIDSWAQEIVSLSEENKPLTDAELVEKANSLREKISSDPSLVDDKKTISDVFAVSMEASDRVLKQRPYKVQVMGGLVLASGMIAEMSTGEGKTLTAIAPTVLHAMTGRGAHVITVNDYLAERDAEWMGRVYNFLGLSVGVVKSTSTQEERREAYEADVTYVTSTEVGFDYLRDNIAVQPGDTVQRKGGDAYSFALIDEADSILLDDAKTPLIISGGDESSDNRFRLFARLVNQFEEGEGYDVDRAQFQVTLLDPLIDEVERRLGLDGDDNKGGIYRVENSQIVTMLTNAVKAKALFERDDDYIVTGDGEVLIVDKNTGRALPGRRYNEGLHQAIEAKESVEVQPDNMTVATTTLPSFFGLYDRLAGMTGTAQSDATELYRTYGLDVITIPTNKKRIRKDEQPVIYATAEDKFNAVADEVEKAHKTGQPVLVGTTSVADSITVSRLLNKRGIEHNTLNASQNLDEALIVARAGRPGAVTVATNMAGRGTDIVLGGNPDTILDDQIRSEGIEPDGETAQQYQNLWNEKYDELKKSMEEDAEKVRQAGGLYVIGTELHDSPRIDNQLKGRSGRQGNPGRSKFFLSLDDSILSRVVDNKAADMFRSLVGLEEGKPMPDSMLRHLYNAQAEVSNRDRESRRTVRDYDDVLDSQRIEIYGQRSEILNNSFSLPNAIELVVETVADAVDAAGVLSGKKATIASLSDDEYKTLVEKVTDNFAGLPDIDYWSSLRSGSMDKSEYSTMDRDELVESISKWAIGRMDEVKKGVEHTLDDVDDPFSKVFAGVAVRTIDDEWQSHIQAMTTLRDGIGLRSVAQMNPLVEYQREADKSFKYMAHAIRSTLIKVLMTGRVEHKKPVRVETRSERASRRRRGIAAATGSLPKVTAREQRREEQRREKRLNKQAEKAMAKRK